MGAGRWARAGVADALSIARIPLGAALAATAVIAPESRATLLICFVLGVVTDVLDGWWARRAGAASDRGASLDSFADAVFTVCTIVALLASVSWALADWGWCAVAAVTAARLAVVAVAWRRFRLASIMHTHLNRATGVAVAVVAGSALATGTMPVWALALAGLVSLAASTEELAIVLRSAEYDRDTRSWRTRPSSLET
ncbi:CDP-alcohol phosphatidyltransferase family protein [Demequina salsinemoris]|uniref:CDP-alcohol phosphatidyltransferase family protein n=1 Tax=Demequina salsinemoris TaxID=577470 RepID=UPI000785AD66|nr:CDP-alcohol phosphatidyltransferase family protein [Demequina salsinemoris]